MGALPWLYLTTLIYGFSIRPLLILRLMLWTLWYWDWSLSPLTNLTTSNGLTSHIWRLVEEQRPEEARDLLREYDSVAASSAVLQSLGYTSRITNYGPVRVCIYEPILDPNRKRHVVMYIHGGGFCVGTAHQDSTLVGYLSSQPSDYQATYVSVDYRLAPEHHHPAALDDCMHVYRELYHSSETPPSLFGTSAGGYLAAIVLQRACEEKIPPCAVLLDRPMIRFGCTSNSHLLFGGYKHLSLHSLLMLWRQYTTYEETIELLGSDTGPPVIVSVFSNDPLRADAVDYAARRQATLLQNTGYHTTTSFVNRTAIVQMMSTFATRYSNSS